MTHTDNVGLETGPEETFYQETACKKPIIHSRGTGLEWDGKDGMKWNGMGWIGMELGMEWK